MGTIAQPNTTNLSQIKANESVNPEFSNIQKLETWKETAESLGKNQGYISRIQELIQGESLSDNAKKAMSSDEQSLAKVTASNWREILSIKNSF